ncbi:hypothetical protein H0H81_009552 [Sphagnurus paluster]|uniref:Uncharacterized protein n=1 Tax=Sphagnurus paluster TaxID=117069 RepID=A0A9P7K5M4_9AGAR|nr:hypothetical protein H0H81_009552 [Sphagnurus paluster]
MSDTLVYRVFTFQNEAPSWTTLSIISIGLFFVLSLFSLADNQPPPTPPCKHLVQARQQQAEEAALLEIEKSRIRVLEIWATDGFQFRELPLELQIYVLSFCADMPATYRSLVLVSRSTYEMTLRACLPLMPITLSSSRQLIAFAKLVHQDETCLVPFLDIGRLVHRLWISPRLREDTILAYRIVRACSNIHSLACDARTLCASIAKCARFKHTMCRELTLLVSRSHWECTMETPSGLQFMRQLTHFRLMGEPAVPRMLALPQLTHLSYLDRPRHPEREAEILSSLEDSGLFPSLEEVILTKRCGPERQVPERINHRLAVIYVLREQTEMELWCNAARGESLWNRARALSVAKKAVRAV